VKGDEVERAGVSCCYKHWASQCCHSFILFSPFP